LLQESLLATYGIPMFKKCPVLMGSTSNPEGTARSGTDNADQAMSRTNTGQKRVTFRTTTGSEDPKDTAHNTPCGNKPKSELSKAS